MRKRFAKHDTLEGELRAFTGGAGKPSPRKLRFRLPGSPGQPAASENENEAQPTTAAVGEGYWQSLLDVFGQHDTDKRAQSPRTPDGPHATAFGGSKRTKRGQPVLSHQVDILLEKIKRG